MYRSNSEQEILYGSFSGIVTDIRPADGQCCSQLIDIRMSDGQTLTFLTTSDTCFLNQVHVTTGMRIIGFFDTSAPVPLIYPPQYRAVVIARHNGNQSITVDRFDRNLLSSNRRLKLNIGPSTRITMPNNQTFTCSPAGRVLVVVYTFTTRSIPAQTTPEQIVVLC